MEPGPYRKTQSLERGINLLVALNELGRAKPALLAKRTGIERTTAYRLLATLERMQLVTRSPSDNTFVLRSNVRKLSDGFNEFDRTSRITTEAMGVLLKQVEWPSDFSTFEDGWMVIQETTHRFSHYSVHRAMVGQRWRLLQSSVGRAYLAGIDRDHRRTVLDMAYEAGAVDGTRRKASEELALLIEDFEERGYAWSAGGSDPRISAIALPVTSGGQTLGALNVLFFKTAMSVDEAAVKFLPHLRTAVETIRGRLADSADADSGAGMPELG